MAHFQVGLASLKDKLFGFDNDINIFWTPFWISISPIQYDTYGSR